MDKQANKTGRPNGIKTVDGNKKEIRRFLSGKCSDFQTYFDHLTSYEKVNCLMEYLKGGI